MDVLAKAYSTDLLNINAFAAFNSGNDWGVLYAGASDSGAVYAFSDEVTEVLHKRHSDFTGLWDDMRFIPETVGGDPDSPVLEIARTETINELSGTINNLVGVIDRQDTTGHYVSQPLAIGAVELDKLYWNETIPGVGGDVTFQVRTSPTGEANLLLNDDFEFWDNWVTGTPSTEQPNDWAFTQDGAGGSVDQSTTEVKRGTYSAKITKSDADQSEITIAIPNPTNYRSKTLAFSAWAKSANTVASKVRVQLTDGTGTTTTDYANGGDWEELEGTLAVVAGATAITFKLVVETGADAVAYFDRVMVREASSAANDWSAWSAEFTDSSGSDISGVTADAYIQYLINMETDNIISTPNIIRSGTQAGSYNVRLTYQKQGTPQSSNIPLHYRTGFLDLGHPSKPKIIRGIETYHSGTAGSFTVGIEAFGDGENHQSFEGDSDSWTVDLASTPSKYKEYSTDGALRGQLFVVDVTSNDEAALTLNKILIHYDSEPNV